MGEEFGFIHLEKKTNPFLSDNVTGSYSDATATRIDNEIMKIISQCYTRTIELLKENRKELDALAAKLYEKENITGQEFMDLLSQLDQNSNSSPTVTS